MDVTTLELGDHRRATLTVARGHRCIRITVVGPHLDSAPLHLAIDAATGAVDCSPPVTGIGTATGTLESHGLPGHWSMVAGVPARCSPDVFRSLTRAVHW